MTVHMLVECVAPNTTHMLGTHLDKMCTSKFVQSKGYVMPGAAHELPFLIWTLFMDLFTSR
jgi:hypothetical protein